MEKLKRSQPLPGLTGANETTQIEERKEEDENESKQNN